jgi:hypothetical protein
MQLAVMFARLPMKIVLYNVVTNRGGACEECGPSARCRHRLASCILTPRHPHLHLHLHDTNFFLCMEHRKPRDALSCDRCRRKKLKCSKDAPVCTSCAHSGSQCHYSGKVTRSPLTRAYLTGVEKRLHSLEAVVSQLLPGVNINDILSSPDLAGTTPPIINPRTPEVAPSPQGSTNSNSNEPALPEAVPNNADGFNWQEENINVDGLTDGMAALSVEPTGVGYLGQSLRPHDEIGD